MTQCFHHLFSSPSPSVLSIFNADGFYLAPRWWSQEASAWVVCNMEKEKESRKHKEVQKKDQLFCDMRRLFTQSWLDPRRGALNSQSGGIKIATLCIACGPKDWMCAGYLKLFRFLSCHMTSQQPALHGWGYSVSLWCRQVEKYTRFVCTAALPGRSRVNISAADKRWFKMLWNLPMQHRKIKASKNNQYLQCS